MTPLNIKTYAQYTEQTYHLRGSLRLGFTEVAKRDPLGPEIPKNAFKVTFYDRPDPVDIQGRTATFGKENFSNPVYLGDTIIHLNDLKAHFQDATDMLNYYEERIKATPEAQVLVKTRTRNYEIVNKGDEVMNSKGQKIWPLPVFPLGGN